MKLRIAAGFFCALATAGCSTVNPLTMEKTERDKECYVAEEPVSFEQGRKKIVVVSKVIIDRMAGDTNQIGFLEKAVESSTAHYFSNLGWFRTTGRDNGLSVDAKKVLADNLLGGNVDACVDADFALVVESSIAFIAKQSWKKTAFSGKARGAQVESDFRLIDIGLKELLFSMKFRSSAECGKGDIRSAISDATDMNARKFARIVSARYLPPGRVTETRGSGRCARVTIGKNYMLNAEGAQPATRVDFFVYERDKNSAEGRLEKVVVAHGTVIAADKNEAWVEVDADWIDKATGLATYNVKKGHYVKISEEAVENETE